ncbi:MAG: RluA family pseudouridine synthase, partial [Alphaproteobacteria bacterium]|nr:RluA family pseudouridine synthase [Alphaproteobacteria bacterium]
MSGVQMITIGPDEGDQRLDRWFRRRFPHVSQGRIEKMCRKGEIRIDGGRAKGSTRITVGQQVRVPPLPDTAAPAPAKRTEISDADAEMMQRAVLWRDDHII